MQPSLTIEGRLHPSLALPACASAFWRLSSTTTGPWTRRSIGSIQAVTSHP